ncbi:hypothetical protein [Streptomyces sp. NPDC058667]|uniref:hypothetical protein n=1 Tax=Streptomyces sp. NPDC058667 TaxID=3346588 RepID=UPI003648A808
MTQPMTDREWEAQNSGSSPQDAEKKGLCGTCGGKKKLWSAFGGVQQVFTCHDCKGTGANTSRY